MLPRRRSSLLRLLVNFLFVLGSVALIDRMQHMAGIEPCFLTRLADSLSGLTGIPDEYCVTLLIMLVAYAMFQLSRGILGLVAER